MRCFFYFVLDFSKKEMYNQKRQKGTRSLFALGNLGPGPFFPKKGLKNGKNY